MKYATKVALLKSANKLLTDKLFAKRTLIVPPPDRAGPPPGGSARPLFLLRTPDGANHLLPEDVVGPPPAWDRTDGFLSLRPESAAGCGGATCVGAVFAPHADCVITR